MKSFIKLIRSAQDVYTYIQGVGYVKVTKASLIAALTNPTGVNELSGDYEMRGLDLYLN